MGLQLTTHPFDLHLRNRFTISRGSVSTKQTLIVCLTDGTHRGYGEATVNDYYGATIESMQQALELARTDVEAAGSVDPALLWSQVADRLDDHPFALCALDQAAHDLWGKQQGAPVYRLWGLNANHLPVSNFTIGIDEIDVMVRKLHETAGWPSYKIKLGTDHDLEIVRELRRHTKAPFRVDANCAWTPEQTIEYSRELTSLGVEFIEQPLPADDWDGAERVYQESALPVIADESCIAEVDVARCHGRFHGVNIKLMKCGGLTPARRMIDEARRLGLKVMVGCMTESTVGISAIAQLLPLLDYVDMDGAALLASDIATGVRVEQGVCHYADENGTGARLIH